MHRPIKGCPTLSGPGLPLSKSLTVVIINLSVPTGTCTVQWMPFLSHRSRRRQACSFSLFWVILALCTYMFDREYELSVTRNQISFHVSGKELYSRCTIIVTSSIHFSSISTVNFCDTRRMSSPPRPSRRRDSAKFSPRVLLSRARPTTVTQRWIISGRACPSYKSASPSEHDIKKMSLCCPGEPFGSGM